MMDLDETPLLHEPDLMLAVLRVGAAKSGTLDDCIDHLRLLRRCAQVDELVPEVVVRSRLETALAKLHRAGLIEVPVPGQFRITARGRQVLADNPDGVDDTVLMQLPEFRSANGHAPARASSPSAPTRTERAPTFDYHSGYEACLAGANLADNPHPRDVRAYLDWANGWSQARDDHLTQSLHAEPERRRPGKAGARRGNDRASDRSQ
jgi:ribosome modulation factor